MWTSCSACSAKIVQDLALSRSVQIAFPSFLVTVRAPRFVIVDIVDLVLSLESVAEIYPRLVRIGAKFSG
jgi:hypothetical protein